VGGGKIIDVGADTWKVTVDYGDGVDAAHPDLQAVVPTGRTFELDHQYTREGSFLVTVFVSDGGSIIAQSTPFYVHVYLGAPGEHAVVLAGQGQNDASGGINGLDVTIHKNGDLGNPAGLVLVTLPLDAVNQLPIDTVGSSVFTVSGTGKMTNQT